MGFQLSETANVILSYPEFLSYDTENPRCKSAEEKYGKPSRCEGCKKNAYFDKGLEAKKKVRDILSTISAIDMRLLSIVYCSSSNS